MRMLPMNRRSCNAETIFRYARNFAIILAVNFLYSLQIKKQRNKYEKEQKMKNFRYIFRFVAMIMRSWEALPFSCTITIGSRRRQMSRS